MGWQLEVEISASKSTAMLFFQGKIPMEEHLQISWVYLLWFSEVKDFGLHFVCQLTWKTHILMMHKTCLSIWINYLFWYVLALYQVRMTHKLN